MPAQGIWTDEKIDDLKRRWAEGETTTVIALALGTTRSTISGKIDRLGLQGRPQIAKTPEELEAKRKQKNAQRVANKRLQRHREDKLNRDAGPREPKPVPVCEPFAGSLDIRFGDLRPFFDTVPNQCRFIAGDAADPDCTACGNVTPKGESWCAHHKAIVYRAPIQVSEEERFKRACNIRRVRQEIHIVRTASLDVREASA